MRSLRLALALAVVLAGCAAREASPEPERASVDPPADAGGLAECPPAASQSLALNVRATATRDAGGRGPGIHRLANGTFLWVWASYAQTLREDNVTRMNAVDVARAANGTLVLCTRVDLSAPIEVDRTPWTYDVAAWLEPREPLPAGPVSVTVSWIAGCPCDPLPRGHITADFVEP